MPDGDCFQVLGIAPGSSAAQVRQAWRREARKHHPDVGGDTRSMSRLNAALTEALRLVTEPPAMEPELVDPGRARHASPGASGRRPTRVRRDVPSFTIDCLPVESFELLTIVAATLGSVIEEEIPYLIEFTLESSGAIPGATNWCRCEIFPEAGASSVHLTIGAAPSVGEGAVEALRDEIVRILNGLCP